MKNLFLAPLLLFLFVALSSAQVVTTNPTIVTQESGVIEVVFDATKGTAGLKGYTGNIYAHTGVITNKSTSSSDWKYVKAGWTENKDACKMISLGNDKWKLIISPDIRGYYGITDASEVVKQLAFVFRSSDGAKEGKDTGGKDIFVDVREPGLSVKFTSPDVPFLMINKNAIIYYTAEASMSSTLKLYIDNTQFGTTVTGTTISQSYILGEGSYWAIVEASTAEKTVRDSIFVTVKKDVETAARPSFPDGINIIDNNTVTFILYAPKKNDVFVVGDFNKWLPANDYMMKKDGDYWWLTVNNLQPDVEYAFQYLIDGSLYVGDAYAQKVLDPWNDKYIPSSTYSNLKPYPAGKNSDDGMVSVFRTNEPVYNWQVTNFEPPRQDKLVIYELLIRDFTSTSDLNGVMSKLDYLQNLGINAIELMPTQEFDGNDSWGYNPCYYFAMDKAYGTKEMYKKFIDECHKRGLAVILDVVFNHATGQHPFAKMYWNAATNKTAADNPWFNVDAPHPYSVFHDFNHESPLVRTYFKRNLKFLLEEYNLDGFRFDLTKGFTQKQSTESTASNYDASRIAILEDYYGQIKATNANAYMIIEHFCADSEEKELANAGLMPWGNKNNAYCQSVMGYQSSSEFTGVNGWTRSWTYNNLVGYMESHDEERTIYKAKAYGATNAIKTDLVTQMDRAALNAAFFIPIPGAKMIWQFGELGYDYSINSTAGSSIISSDNRTSRKEIRWDYYNVPERKSLYDTYFKLNKLRESYGNAFDNQSYWNMQINAGDWLAGRRICLNSPDLKMVIIGNFNPDADAATRPNFPVAGTWYDLMTGETMNVISTDTIINLTLGKFKILTNKKIDLPSGMKDPKVDKLDVVQTDGYLHILSDEMIFDVTIFGVNGLLVKKTNKENIIPVTDLEKGYYILDVRSESGNTVRKFVIR